MSLDLFAGVPVSELGAAIDWYSRLLGGEEAFRPNEVEAVWELAEHRYLYVELLPESAGHARHTLFVGSLDELEERVAAISARGIEPADLETYDNGVRKVTYRDPDGNEIGLGGGPTQ
ncbi:VOC family protein [Nocardioides insulae]|uniref:VOC family protein n=1 Tax=Nocardioides insulae TaxID=394734 RepID=UPI0004133D38|nr:VOC family protein [Nocardioides insulae]